MAKEPNKASTTVSLRKWIGILLELGATSKKLVASSMLSSEASSDSEASVDSSLADIRMVMAALGRLLLSFLLLSFLLVLFLLLLFLLPSFMDLLLVFFFFFLRCSFDFLEDLDFLDSLAFSVAVSLLLLLAVGGLAIIIPPPPAII